MYISLLPPTKHHISFLKLAPLSQASQSPVQPRSAEHIFCDPSYSFFFFFFFFFFSLGVKEGRLLPVFEAMDHRNLHYHTALQAVH